VNNVSTANNTVTVAARVEPELAAQMRELAAAGDRPLSREIARALRRYVQDGGVTSATSAPGRGSLNGGSNSPAGDAGEEN
jgi:predicted transcriptional regulator